jgi:hypothetical protein
MTTPRKKKTKLKTPPLTVHTIELTELLFVKMIKTRENVITKKKKCGGIVGLLRLVTTVRPLRLQLVTMRSTLVLASWAKTSHVLI